MEDRNAAPSFEQLLADMDARGGRDWRTALAFGAPGYLVGAGLAAAGLAALARLSDNAGALVLPQGRVLAGTLALLWLGYLLRGVGDWPRLRHAGLRWALAGALLGAGVIGLFAISF